VVAPLTPTHLDRAALLHVATEADNRIADVAALHGAAVADDGLLQGEGQHVTRHTNSHALDTPARTTSATSCPAAQAFLNTQAAHLNKRLVRCKDQ
jgi:hypothetical protein